MANTVQECCAHIKDALNGVIARANSALPPPPLPAHATDPHPDLLEVWDIQQQLVDKPPGAQIDVYGTKVPSLASLLQRIHSPLDSGFVIWQWYNTHQPGKTVLTLPQPPGAGARVQVNGSQVAAVRDYTLAGTTLTFTTPLAVGDLVTVKAFAGA